MTSASSGSVYAKEAARYADIYPTPQAQATKGVASLTDTNGKRTLFRQTFWRDPNDETKLLSAQLDERILARLAAKFGKESVRFSEDGSVTLKGKAEAFAAGWHRSLENNGGGEGGGLSGARMRFDIGFQEGAITGVRVAASPHHTSTLGEQAAALAAIDGIFSNPLGGLAKLEAERPKIFEALGADIAAAQFSAVFHSAMIDLASRTLRSDSIDEALNRALTADNNFDGEIALEELVNSRFRGEKTEENYMNELAQKYIDYAAEMFDRPDRVPASLHNKLIENGYVLSADTIGEQRVHIMTMEQVIETVNRYKEMLLSETAQKNEEENAENTGAYLENNSEIYRALQQDHINGKITIENTLQQMENLSRKINEYYQTDKYLEKEKANDPIGVSIIRA